MTDEERKRQFQVVPKVRREDITAGTFIEPMLGAQTTLFPVPRPGLLIFVYFPEVSEDEFLKALEIAKPGVVMELRNTPRFDIGRLNRRIVFQCFDAEHSKYLDLTTRRIERSEWTVLLNEVRETLRQQYLQFDRPMMFLLSSYNSARELSEAIIDLVSDIKKTPPEVVGIPRFVVDGH